MGNEKYRGFGGSAGYPKLPRSGGKVTKGWGSHKPPKTPPKKPPSGCPLPVIAALAGIAGAAVVVQRILSSLV